MSGAAHPHANALFDLALHKQRLGDTAGAEAHYRRALALVPHMGGARLNLGVLLLQQQRLDEAEAELAAALFLDNRSSQVWANLGSLYVARHNEADAETALRQAIALDPDNRNARFNLAYLQLRRGHFEEGWALFEARDWYLAMEQQLPLARWQGEPLQGRRVLLCLEAGHGDLIQFCRYVQLFREQGAHTVDLVCHPALLRLLSGLPGLDRALACDGPVPIQDYDYWSPLLSAPWHFHPHTGAYCGAMPYLHAPTPLCDHWRSMLVPGRRKVGLAWCGNPAFENDRARSLHDMQLLAPLWEAPEVAWVSLQKGPAEAAAQHWAQRHPMLCLGARMHDFADAAAIIANLDLVISVDTAMAHLAGALGKPCWLLLPDYMTDWRWGVGADTTPWYPGTMRLYRQGSDQRWEPVLERVRQDLHRWCGEATA